ncbi:UNVERIFIED_CONTAM: hypothetical protein HDU68_000761 [Siphonaria sp. JEL0065]|nr:hypothetical protein HDU68_000761 [Siphonaria sp. JEL0065]
MSFSWTDFINKGLATFSPASTSTSQIHATNPDATSSASQPAATATQHPTLASSVSSLAGPDGYVDPLAVADYISYTVNTGFAMTASKVFGYNLEFSVHEKGCVLVTGASGKIGAHATRTLASLGYTVFAGVKSLGDGRKLVSKGTRDGSVGKIVPLVLDVTDPASLRSAFEIVARAIGVAVDSEGELVRLEQKESSVDVELLALQSRALSPNRGRSRLSVSTTYEDIDEDIDTPTGNNLKGTAKLPENVLPEDLFIGIINCEGTESPGALEVVPLNEIMRCYEINTAGAVAVTQCFLPLLRESKGRIINVCSSVGVTAAPINGSYAASKMALIAVSESLRIELYSFGISVSIIEPGSLEAWSPKKNQSEPTHSLQLGQNASSNISSAFPTDESQDKDAPLPSMPVVSRSKSRSHLRMSAPPSSLPSLNEDEEIPYVSPLKKTLSNRRGSGSVDENNRPSSPQVFPYQTGLASPPHSPSPLSPKGNSSIPLPTKRRSVSSLSGYNPPQPTTPLPPPPPLLSLPAKRATTSLSTTTPTELSPLLNYKPTNPRTLRRASTTDPRLDRARSTTSSLSVNPSAGIHPTWDATDRARVTQKLYGPLMNTVAEVSQGAADRARENEKGERESVRRKSIGNLTTSGAVTPGPRDEGYNGPPAKPRRRAQSVAPGAESGAFERAVELGVVEQQLKQDLGALTSSCRHVSRAIVHSLTSPFPKTRYRVGWDAKTTSVLRWALPDRFLDWGYVAMSGGSNHSGATR